MTEIVVDHLSKDFGPVRAVDDLTFAVPSGEVTGFLGPNGAGKTTTLRCLLGLIAPTSGKALIAGARYSDLAEPARTVGAALEASSFHPGRTARNHLRVLCAAAGLPDRRAEEVLDLTGLTSDADRRVGGYSTGMRQRLALSAALLGDPGYLVLDEPATGLDPAGISWLRELLEYMAHDLGKTVLVSSHLLAEMEHTADRVVIITGGRLVKQGQLEDIINAAGAGVRVRTPSATRMSEVLRDAGLSGELRGEELFVPSTTAERVGHLAYVNGIELSGLAERPADLEAVFLQLTNSDHHQEPASERPAAVTSGRP
ncbi:MAG TPA: ATP-binding cassette domain-containing protein [Acidimicrobiales bacterium]|nr:ATP-binding cassette domain-containing protein [Acidimicrobiales bacterium]